MQFLKDGVQTVGISFVEITNGFQRRGPSDLER